MAKKSFDRSSPALRKGIKQRRAILNKRIDMGRVSLPELVWAALDSADATRTDFDVVTELLNTEDRDDRIAAARCIEELANAYLGRHGANRAVYSALRYTSTVSEPNVRG